MNKQELLSELKRQIDSKELNINEVTGFLESSAVMDEPRSVSTTKILYFIGAVIAISGVVTFVAQIWDDLGAGGHIVVTLGLGLIFALVGSILMKQRPEEEIGSVFHILGGVLIPSGALVTLNELIPNQVDVWPVVWTFMSISIFYIILTLAQRKAVLTFFAIANSTAFMYFIVEALNQGNYYMDDIYKYLTILVGASYLFLAYSFKSTENKCLAGVLNFFGSFGILLASFTLIFDSALWRTFYFFLVFGCIMLSVYVKSRGVLVVSTGFLLAYISYISGKYFADSLGWPVTLIILGMVFIGLGYFSIRINNKYIN